MLVNQKNQVVFHNATRQDLDHKKVDLSKLTEILVVPSHKGVKGFSLEQRAVFKQ